MIKVERYKTINSQEKIVNNIMEEKRTPFINWAVIFFMFVSIGRVQDFIPINLYLGKVLGILMIFGYILHSGLKNRITFKDSPEMVCISGILILALVSVPFSVWPTKSVDVLLNLYLKNLIYFYIIARILVTTNQINKTVYALIVTVTLLSVLAFVNRTGIARITASSFYDPNDFAFLFVCVLPFVIFKFIKERGIKKILLLLSGSLMMTIIILTRSRGGFIGLLAVGAFILLKTLKKSKLLAGLILLGSITVFTLATPTGYWDRMETIVEPGDDYNVYSPSGRIELWKKGIKLMLGSPFTGVGVGNFVTAEGLLHKGKGGKWSTAHNSFIQIGGELGVGGFILFILLFYYLFKSLRRITSKDPTIKALKDSLEVSLIGYATAGFFLSQAYSMILYIIVGMTIALKYVVKRSDLNHV